MSSKYPIVAYRIYGPDTSNKDITIFRLKCLAKRYAEREGCEIEPLTQENLVKLLEKKRLLENWINNC